MYKLNLEKTEEPELITNICWIIEKARIFQKRSALLTMLKAFDCVDHNKLWKIIYLFIYFYFTVLYWFCHTSTCICHGCTRVPHPEPPLPPPSPYRPSGLSQCISPKLPVSCIEPGLSIRFLYDIIHVLMPFSQIILHLPLPQSPKDCSVHLCLFCCLEYRVVVTIFLNSIYMR